MFIYTQIYADMMMVSYDPWNTLAIYDEINFNYSIIVYIADMALMHIEQIDRNWYLHMSQLQRTIFGVAFLTGTFCMVLKYNRQKN